MSDERRVSRAVLEKVGARGERARERARRRRRPHRAARRLDRAVRPVVPADAPALREFLGGLSENSRWLRFFSLGVNLDKAASAAAAGDRPEGYGLIVTTGAEERVVAHAVFELERPDRAEVAFAVADEMQGRGLATVLIAHLAQVASARGVTTFTATVLPENRRMISVFRESGLPGRRCTPRRTGSSSSSRPSWARTRGASSRTATGSRRSPRSSACCGRGRSR